MSTKLLSLIAASVTVGLVQAAILAPDGDLYNGTANWSPENAPFEPLNLTVDDSIVFKYIKNAHTAIVTTSSDCTGGEQLPLEACAKEPKIPGQPRQKYYCAVYNASDFDDGVQRWVYSNVSGDCEAGLNLAVTVGSGNGTGAVPPPVTSPPTNQSATQPLFFALHDGEGCNSSTIDAYVVSGVLTGMCNRLSSNSSTIATCDSISVYENDNCQGDANTTALSDFCGGPSLRNATITCVENATYVRIDIFGANDTTCSDWPIGTEFAVQDACMVSDAGLYFVMSNVTNDTLELSIYPPWNCMGDSNETGTIPLDSCIFDNLTGRYYTFSLANASNLTVFASSAGEAFSGARLVQVAAALLVGIVVSFAT